MSAKLSVDEILVDTIYKRFPRICIYIHFKISRQFVERFVEYFA